MESSVGSARVDMERLYGTEQAAGVLGLSSVQYKHMCDVATLAFEKGRGESVALVWRAEHRVDGWIGGFSWLENVAPGLMATVRFSVEGREIKEVIRDLVSRYGESVSVTALWHSHQRSTSASTVDVREFPGWLSPLGAIFVVQGGVTVFYSGENSFVDKVEEHVDG